MKWGLNHTDTTVSIVGNIGNQIENVSSEFHYNVNLGAIEDHMLIINIDMQIIQDGFFL